MFTINGNEAFLLQGLRRYCTVNFTGQPPPDWHTKVNVTDDYARKKPITVRAPDIAYQLNSHCFSLLRLTRRAFLIDMTRKR